MSLNQYTLKKDYFSKENITNNIFSFSPSDYREIKLNESNKKLKEYIKNYKTGYEIGSDQYVNKSKIRFLKTNNISNSILLDDSRIEYCIPNNKAVIPKNESILLVKDGGTGGLGEVCLYKTNKDYKDYISSGIIKINIEDFELRYYILGILKSNHFKEFIDNKTSGGSTIRHSKLISLDYNIPIPENKEIYKIISLYTQNLVDKEIKIKEKNNEINKVIKEELEKHSHPHLNTPYSNEILENNFRFDSGLYSKEYKSIQESITSYDSGYFDLLDEYNSKRGPNLAESVIGLSIYKEEKKENFYRLITNVEFTEDRTLSSFRYLGNKTKLPLIPKNSIMLSADGSVGRCIYVDDLSKTITNYHPWILTPKKNETPIYQNVYTAMFLGYLRTVGFYEKIQDKSNGGGIKAPHLQNWIKIPKFPESIQKDIAIKYYNKVEKNVDLSIENYLEKEKERNSRLGILQLNMEVFELKDKIEELVSKIVYNEEINISDYI
ncbi:hypothetical protein PJV90_02225 [Aliarcobacter butzleri]|uniref:restriction endonuclease subunit S n=1 Tax=Aliarcobacter butzleri TaxID=28197 RepID=UPI00263D4764|nr:hypothetical protein [Aliarcobacter butzleri]MDN5127143.1 hypothetical protein [Aliarcobacter butzleri]